MAKRKKDDDAASSRRRVLIVNADGSEAPQLELALGDPIVITDDDGRRYMQFRLA